MREEKIKKYAFQKNVGEDKIENLRDDRLTFLGSRYDFGSFIASYFHYDAGHR